MYKNFNFEFPESAGPKPSVSDKDAVETYVREERNRLKTMLVKMMKYYEDNSIPYACKTSAGHSFDLDFDFDPSNMQLQDRDFMSPPRELEKPKVSKKKKKKSADDDDFIAENSDENSSVCDSREDERGASSSSSSTPSARPVDIPSSGGGSKRKTLEARRGGSSSSRSKQTPDVGAMFDAEAHDDNGDNDSEGTAEGDDEYQDVEAEHDNHGAMKEVSLFENPDGLTWKQWPLPSGAMFHRADTGHDGQFYVCDHASKQSNLCIHNLLIKKHRKRDSIGRFRDRYKIINIYLTERGEQDLTWLSSLIKDLDTIGSVVSGMPAMNGEFDLIKIKGIREINEDRRQALQVKLKDMILNAGQAGDKAEKLYKAEEALIETLCYEFIAPSHCACGCGFPAEMHRCTACKDAFFPGCLEKKDEQNDGLCKVCNLVDQEPSGALRSPAGINELSPFVNKKVNKKKLQSSLQVGPEGLAEKKQSARAKRVVPDDDDVASADSPSKKKQRSI